jgi:hypothetical protein
MNRMRNAECEVRNGKKRNNTIADFGLRISEWGMERSGIIRLRISECEMGNAKCPVGIIAS